MDEQVELLRGIWNEMKALNGRVDTTNERLGNLEGGLNTLRGGLDSLHDEAHAGFRDFSERIDAVHERSVWADLRIASPGGPSDERVRATGAPRSRSW
jgi:hypothetical protein